MNKVKIEIEVSQEVFNKEYGQIGVITDVSEGVCVIRYDCGWADEESISNLESDKYELID